MHRLMGVQGTHSVWPPGTQPEKPEKVAGKNGRTRTRYVAEGEQPWPIAELALQVPPEELHIVTWHEGSRGQKK